MTADDISTHKAISEQTTANTTNPNMQTTITTTTTVIEENEEPDKLDFDFDPNKQLNQALEDDRKAERECIQQLIDENVRLEKKVKMVKEDAQQFQAKYAALQIELEALRAQRHRITPKETETLTETKTINDSETETYDVKVRDLQFRLKKLAEDDKAKELVIDSLSRGNDENKSYIARLEQRLGPEAIQEVQQDMASNNDDTEKAKVVDRSQLVRQGHVTNSAICSIM